MKPVETTKRLEAIKEKVKAKTIVEQAEKDERPPMKLLERQIMVTFLDKFFGKSDPKNNRCLIRHWQI